MPDTTDQSAPKQPGFWLPDYDYDWKIVSKEGNYCLSCWKISTLDLPGEIHHTINFTPPHPDVTGHFGEFRFERNHLRAFQVVLHTITTVPMGIEGVKPSYSFAFNDYEWRAPGGQNGEGREVSPPFHMYCTFFYTRKPPKP